METNNATMPLLPLDSPLKRSMKRLFDFFGALVLLTMLMPFLIVVACLVRASGKQIIFGHERIGVEGKPFKCLKFRTMVVNAQEVLHELLENDPIARAEWEKDFKLKNDPRITAIGAFLRKTSLDELPQLFNVLKGEMSLVGPRPVIDEEIKRYGPGADYYFAVRPGMTGLWQVSGRNDVDYDERISMDVEYVRNWSFNSDILILLRTIGVVFGKKGAY